MLYFLPDARSCNAATLATHGLSAVIDRPSYREVTRGPSGSSGVVVCQADSVENLRFDPTQKWAKRFGSEAWIGFDPASRPGPKTLARETMQPGVTLTLADGDRWVIPQLRSFDAQQLDGPFSYSCNLDRTLSQDPDTGRMVPGEVIPQYRHVWDAAIKIGEALLDQLRGRDAKVADLPEDSLEQFVADVLQINYRVGMPEISQLGLLTVSMQAAVMRAAIDFDTLRANLGNRLRRAGLGTPTTTPAAATPTDSPDGNTASGETPPTEA